MEQDTKQFYRNVAKLVFPMALQNLINVGVTAADVIMLGKVGETVLSASSLANQIYFIMTLIFFGLTSGAAVLTAQYWGRHDTRTIEKIMGMALRMGILTAVVFTAMALCIPDKLMYLFTAESAVIAEGVKYLRIIACSYILSGITMVYLNILRSIEKVVVATVVYGVSLGVNVVLNAVFIFGLLGCPAMGIQGAALGTLAARMVEIVIVFFYARRNQIIRVHVKDLFLREPELAKDFRKYAVPVIMNEFVWGAGMAVVSAIIGHIGSAAVAAHSVAQVTRQLATVVSFGVASATAIICGKAIGERREDLAKLYAKRLLRMAFVLGLGAAALVLCASPIARKMLNLSADAKSYLTMMMCIIAYFVVCQSMSCTMIVGIFRSGGDTKYGLLLDTVTLWGGCIGLGTIGAFVLHIPMPYIYLILTMDEICKLPFAYRRYKSYKWLKNVTR